MWKKFLASLAIVGMFFTSSASALVIGGDTGTDDGTYISNFMVTPDTFAPARGETAEVSFDLSVHINVYSYVVDSDLNIVATFSDGETALAPGHATATWYGTVGNVEGAEALPDGEYTAKAFAMDKTGSILEMEVFPVTLFTTDLALAPIVSNLSADTGSFSAQGGEDTEISFEVDKDGYLDVDVMDGEDVVKTFTEYDGNDWYRHTESHSINWDGTDNDGEVVADGTYTVVVTSTNNQGSNVASMDVTVFTTANTPKSTPKTINIGNPAP